MSIPYYIILSDSDDESDHSSTTLGSPMSPFHPDVSDDIMGAQPQPTAEDFSEEEEEPMEEDGPGSTSTDAVPFFYQRNRHGARTVTTARKTVGISQGSLLPTPAATTTTPAATTTTPAATTPTPAATSATPTAAATAAPLRRVDARRWGWLSDTLRTWEKQEGLPRTHEIGESSTAQPRVPVPVPVPQDPATILLIARMTRQEQAHHTLRSDLERSEAQTGTTIQGHVSELWADAHLTDQSVGTIHTQLTEARHDAARLRYRLEQSERHAAELSRRLSVLEGRLEQAGRFTPGASSSRQPGHYHI